MSSPGVAGSQGERDRAKEEREREGRKRTEGAETWQGEREYAERDQVCGKRGTFWIMKSRKKTRKSCQTLQRL